MDLDVRSLKLLEPEQAASCIASLVEALAQANGMFLREFPKTPSLYTAGIAYEETEAWRDIPALLAARKGDCKSLVAWRLAELRKQGTKALVQVVYIPRPGEHLFHVQIRKGGGTEDPSRFLGMRT